MKKTSSLSTKLKQCDPQVKDFIRALKAENAKLQVQIAKLEVDKITKDNRVKALEKAKPSEKLAAMTTADITAKLVEIVRSNPDFARAARAALP